MTALAFSLTSVLPYALIHAAPQNEELQIVAIVTGVAGGLALFLFGMDYMTKALKAVAGERMRKVLATLTVNRFMGVLTGAFVTAVIQSSSVTTVLVVGFITSGLMSLSQSIGVIIGANIGTTITAQIIAFKVTKFALVMVAVGFGMMSFSEREQLRNHGSGILGLGLVFFGMSIMGDAIAPLRTYQPFVDWMIRFETPLVGVLAGTVFTAVVQSSSATTGVVIVMAGQGLITLPAGIALAFGANIGTCVTALLAAIGKTREAFRASLVHVIFNVLGVLVWIAFVRQLGDLVTIISPAAQGLAGTERLAAEVPRQIANAHTVFNVANTLLFIGFSTQLARLVEWLVPDRPLEEEAAVRAKYLDGELLSTPSLALDRARLELLHMGNRVKDMMEAILPTIFHGTRADLEKIAEMDDAVDALHGSIVTYLGKISQAELNERQTADLVRLMAAANELENIGDIIETNLVSLGVQRIDQEVVISDATKDVIAEFHGIVSKALDSATQAVTQRSADAANAVISMKAEINRLSESAAIHESRRLIAQEPKRIAAYRLETDILESIKRIYYFCKRMARAMVPTVSV